MFYEEQDESEEQYLKDSEARQKNLKMAHVMLDIAQNASIRGMRVDGEDRFSVLDFITYVCPGRNSSYAKTVWKRLISNDSDNSLEVVSQVVPKWDHVS